MKKILGITSILALAMGILAAATFGVAADSSGSDDASAKKLRHVVLFKFKEGTSPADVKKIVDAFAALPSQIPQIAELEYGTDVSVENKADGFTHCFLVTFAGEQDRAVYLPHPAHKAFGQILRPHLDKVLVFDYFTN